MPPIVNRLHLDKDFIPIGRRFACCENVSSREDLERIAWRTGVIRAATELDTSHPDQQFCVEWDGKDPVRDYEWIYLHDTAEEDRYDNVQGGSYSCFLIEDHLMWSENESPLNGAASGGSKASKSHGLKSFRPAATFLALVDHVDYNARNRVPVRLLAENTLAFVDKDQLNAFPVQQHQTSLTMKGSVGVPVQKDHQIAINQWFDIRRSQQRLIRDKDKQLIGQSVQVYWKDGASQRWYSACLKGYSTKDQTVTVMDYNVIQDRKVDPRLEEIQIVKDYGRSVVPATSTSPTPVDNSRAARNRRASTKSDVSIKPERKGPAKSKKGAVARKSAASSSGTGKAGKSGVKAKNSEPMVKRPRGRPPAIAKKKRPIPVKITKSASKSKRKVAISSSEDEEDMDIDDEDDEEEELTLQVKAKPEPSVSGSESEESDDDQPTWSLSKLAKKKVKAPVSRGATSTKQPANAAPPAKRKARSPSPVQQNRLPLKKRQEKKKDKHDEESEGMSSGSDKDEDLPLRDSSSESEPPMAPTKKAAGVAPPTKSKKKERPPPAKSKAKDGGGGSHKSRKAKSESESPNRVVSSRPRKPPVSYREKSEPSEDEPEPLLKIAEKEKEVPKVEPPKEENPVEVVKPKVPAYNPLNVRKVKPRKQAEKAVVPPVINTAIAAQIAVDTVSPVKEVVDSKVPQALIGNGKSEMAKSPDRSGNETLKNALAAPPVVLAQTNQWHEPPSSKHAAPQTTGSGRPTPKKMARVAGQPQGVSPDFPREVADARQPADASSFHQQHRPAERTTGQNAYLPTPAAAVAAPALPVQQAPPLAQPPPTAPVDFFHPAAQQQQPPIRYPPQQYGQYPGYPQPPQPQSRSMSPSQQQQQQRHQSQTQQMTAASQNPSPFRATTPSPFVPRNSPVSNPQASQPTSQASYRGGGGGGGGTNSSSQYSAPQSHQQQQPSQQPHHMPTNQNYPTGAVIPGYGGPTGFYYPGHMAGGSGGFTAGAVMYPGAGGAMYPLHLPQGGQWDSLMFNPMMAGIPAQHANRAQTEEFQRMAVAQAQAAANNRAAAVRSTATSPDLRPSSSNNHLTGVITGAMQALNNFQIPSPPLGSGTSFGAYGGTPPGGSRHATLSGSPAPPAMSLLQPGKESAGSTHRPSSTHSNASSGKASRTPEPSLMRNSPNLLQQTGPSGPIPYPLLQTGYPARQPTASKARERGASKSKASPKADLPSRTKSSSAAKQAASESAPEKPPSKKRIRKKPTPAVPPPIVPSPAVTLPLPLSIVSSSTVSQSMAGEPCPLTMLSAIATSMMPVEVQLPVAPPAMVELALILPSPAGEPQMSKVTEESTARDTRPTDDAVLAAIPATDSAVTPNPAEIAETVSDSVESAQVEPDSNNDSMGEEAVTEKSVVETDSVGEEDLERISLPVGSQSVEKSGMEIVEESIETATAVTTVPSTGDLVDGDEVKMDFIEGGQEDRTVTIVDEIKSDDGSTGAVSELVVRSSDEISETAPPPPPPPAPTETVMTTTTPTPRPVPIVSYPNSDEEEEDGAPRLRICEDPEESARKSAAIGGSGVVGGGDGVVESGSPPSEEGMAETTIEETTSLPEPDTSTTV